MYARTCGADVNAGQGATLLPVVLRDEVQDLLEAAFPDGQVSVVDFGGGDHLAAHVRAPQFSGLPLIDQHRLVYGPVQHLLDAGTLHALKIKTEAST